MHEDKIILPDRDENAQAPFRKETIYEKRRVAPCVVRKTDRVRGQPCYGRNFEAVLVENSFLYGVAQLCDIFQWLLHQQHRRGLGKLDVVRRERGLQLKPAS